MRKKARFHSLKKLRVRQDWSRWSLYSIAKVAQPSTANRTFFQQKWTAKAVTRAYHGEHIREKQWKHTFRRNLPAVVPMDHKYLARYNGSEQASGRGSGADTVDKPRIPPMTPYMQMTYFPLERRLDSAIFRSLFASSVRQARQFVVHGQVKVNGKKIPYPGYMLNPGDMFQVNPSSVMFATGAPKTRSSVKRKIDLEKKATRAAENTTRAPPPSDVVAPPVRDEPTPVELKKHMQDLMKSVEEVLSEDANVKAKDKQKFRALRQTIRKSISLWKTANPETISTLDTQFDFLKAQLSRAQPPFSPSPALTTTPSPIYNELAPAPTLSEDEEVALRKAFDKLKLETETTSKWNKRDSSAPYATPWRPRDYMNAFAFIPRYLEVNQNICAAVYLRHPVARPGLAEVPTPFPVETGQLAFTWYLRRR
ncbi:alpha-L RNA-binding motif-containing protein [Pleomassaria siparia CBS 279.74]|uniref:Alpha-L RNA-binding motif-containing protein n=1 Tax=Pleomassaria siparia CBS 279.74 TaxID=1314801 RepID=A0A6G1KKK1_9PLEO|nr:alpha-L RNA-binding motif-containing protein [Pleomassaria siparia CBS 279.74]